jgi:ankyrin repeat protein
MMLPFGSIRICTAAALVFTGGFGCEKTHPPSKPVGMQLLDAAKGGDVNGVQDALSRGAPVDFAFGGGVTALRWSVQGKHLEVVKVLLHHYSQTGKPSEEELSRALIDACNRGWDDGIRVLIESGAAINPPSARPTPLVALIKNHHDAQAIKLIAQGALVSTPDELGNTPMHYAVMPPHSPGRWTLLELLVKRGANVNAVNRNGDSCLHVAARFHVDSQVIAFLTQIGASKTLLNEDGHAPYDLLQWSAREYGLSVDDASAAALRPTG